jgi:5-methylcytosine-specific restriction enzyme subunit McrC
MNELLYEHQSIRLPLTLKARDELEGHLNSLWQSRLAVLPEMRENEERPTYQPYIQFGYPVGQVTPGSYIGVINYKDIRLTILPKIFSPTREDIDIGAISENILYLLSYATNLSSLNTERTSLSERKSLDFLEIFIALFANETLKAYQKNLYRRYVGEEDNLRYLKGKLVFSSHIRENVARGRNDRLYSSFDKFDEDNEFNQIVKFVARCLLRQTRNQSNKRNLNRILYVLSEVTDKACSYQDTTRIVFNRTQREFMPILSLAKLFLRNSLVSYGLGNLPMFSFLIDMNVLFEAFIAGFAKAHFKALTVEAQKGDMWVASSQSGAPMFRMFHDILLTHQGTGWQRIVDTKYKPANLTDEAGGIKQSDLYQMVTYAIRRGCEHVILLYPCYSGENRSKTRFIVHDSFGGDISVTAAKIDLTDLHGSKHERDQAVYSQLTHVLHESLSLG